VSENGTSPREIEADIARQREQLAETIDQLHDQLEVKAKSTARLAAVAAGIALVGLVGLTVWRRRR
jgi:MYXO-CTERM domain-containing protein